MNDLKKHVPKLGPVVGIALLLTGCTLAPRYTRPESPVSSTWDENAPLGKGTLPAPVAWQDYFKDARLRSIIELALRNSRDLRISVLTVEQVAAQYRIQRAALGPSLTGTGTATRAKTPASMTGTGSGTISTQYGVTVGVSAWEIDLFGRVRSLKDQALETFLQAGQTQRAAELSLIAEVANQYVNHAALSEQWALAKETVKVVRQNYELTRRNHELGGASQLDVTAAEALLRSAEVSAASYEREEAAALHALVLLVGADLPASLPPAAPMEQLVIPGERITGLRSEVLLNRPDIQAAEHALKAATASIGAARAAFFPKIALTGSVGTVSPELSGLFAHDTGAWSFAPQVTLPLFANGSNRASLASAQAARAIQVATYEKAVQTAFSEVADTLTAQAPLDRQVDAQRALVTAQAERLRLVEARHKVGAASYLEVLTARQDLYTAQEALVTVRANRLANLVALYRVLGGAVPLGS